MFCLSSGSAEVEVGMIELEVLLKSDPFMKDDDGWTLWLSKFWSAEYINMGVLGFGFLVSCVDHEPLVLLGLI